MEDRKYREWVQSHLLARKWFVRFCIIGLIGFVLENIVLHVTVSELGAIPTVGALFGKELAILFVFFTNNKWTFPNHGVAHGESFVSKLVHCHGIRFVGSTLSLVVLHLLVTLTSVWYILANILGASLAFLFNYVFEHLYVWKTHQS